MKQVRDASQLFLAELKRDQTVKFIQFDLLRDFRNHFLINYVFQKAVREKPVKYFSGEAEYFLLGLVKDLFSAMTSGMSVTEKFNDLSVANTLMRLAQNCANYAAVLDSVKMSYYASRQFSETLLFERLKADWSFEYETDVPPGGSVPWASYLFGQNIQRGNVAPISGVNMLSWESFSMNATKILGRGPGLFTEQFNINSFVRARSEIENYFFGLNFPGFYDYEHSSDALFTLALIYLDYVNVTKDPETYVTILKPESSTSAARLDALIVRARRFMKYYAAMAVAPRFMMMYANLLLIKDLNTLLSPWVDKQISANIDYEHKLKVIEERCSSLVPPRFIKLITDIIQWYKDFYGVGFLIPADYSKLAAFDKLKIDFSKYAVKQSDPLIQSLSYADKTLTQKDIISFLTSRDAYVNTMYHTVLALSEHIQRIDKSVNSIQSWDEFSQIEFPPIPPAKEIGSVNFAVPNRHSIINDDVPFYSIVEGDSGPFIGAVNIVPVLRDLVYGTIKPHLWIRSLKTSKPSDRPSSSFSPAEIRMVFADEIKLAIGAHPMANYAEMPIPADYLAYSNPACYDFTLNDLLNILLTIPSPYKALSDYFSIAAAQFDTIYKKADLASAFAAVGFWFEGEWGPGNKEEDIRNAWIQPSTRFIYGLPTEVFFLKQVAQFKTKADYAKAAVVATSAASDNKFTFLMHKWFPIITQPFMYAQTVCDGFIMDIPVSGTALLDALKAKNKGESWEPKKFREVVLDGEVNGLEPKDFKWFIPKGWSRYTALLPHMTYQTSSSSSVLTDKLLDDPDALKRFVIIGYANDMDLRPISRSFVKTSLVFIEPEDVLLRNTTLEPLTKARVVDIEQHLDKSVIKEAISSKPDNISGQTIIEDLSQGSRNKPDPDIDKTFAPKDNNPKGVSDGPGSLGQLKDSSGKKIFPEKTNDMKDRGLGFTDETKTKDKTEPKGDLPEEPVGSNASATPKPELQGKKKKKVKRLLPDGTTDVVEVDDDYELKDGEEFVE